jgi:uncharacterized membrane protein
MKKLRWLRENWIQVAILAIPFIAIAALWDRFPDRVVVKWNLQGEPVKWAGKTFGLLVGPTLNVAVALFLGWIPRFDPRLRRNPDKNMRSLRAICAAVTLLVAFVSMLVVTAALGYHFNSAVLGSNAVLLMFLVLGNYLGTFPPSYFAGIRTPWTLRNDDVWRATHRNAGRIMVTGVVILLGMQFFITRERTMTCLVAFILASFAWSVGYSYWCYRSIKAGDAAPSA